MISCCNDAVMVLFLIIYLDVRSLGFENTLLDEALANFGHLNVPRWTDHNIGDWNSV